MPFRMGFFDGGYFVCNVSDLKRVGSGFRMSYTAEANGMQ